MPDLRISLVQTPLFWEDHQRNRQMLESKLRALKGRTDLILLPEMFATGFSMNADRLAEEMAGESVAAMKEWASSTGAVVCGSLIIREGERVFNRLIWMPPDGKLRCYDKRHLFTLAGEEKVYDAGKERILINYRGWRICPLICYDLRFPVWSRNTNEYDLLLYVANWPEKRIAAWDILLKARAVENLAYVAGLNRIGKDGNDIYYSGNSSLIDPLGEVLLKLVRQEAVVTLCLSLEKVREVRKRFAFLKDRDQFQILDQ